MATFLILVELIDAQSVGPYEYRFQIMRHATVMISNACQGTGQGFGDQWPVFFRARLDEHLVIGSVIPPAIGDGDETMFEGERVGVVDRKRHVRLAR